MRYRPSHQLSETQRKRSLHRRMLLVHVFFGFCLLIIMSRLLELQLLRGSEYRALAQSQHYGGVVLPARRGEILSVNSKTGETSILATNTTLDLLYVDPLITDDPTLIAESLADILVTEEFYGFCKQGSSECPRELVPFFTQAFDPMTRIQELMEGDIYEPLPQNPLPIDESTLPDITEVRRLFARAIEKRISEKRVRYVPLLYGANKQQLRAVEALAIGGVFVSWESRLIYADPEQVDQLRVAAIARMLADPLGLDPAVLFSRLRSRPLRYAAIMRRLPAKLSAQIRALKADSQELTAAKRAQAPSREAAQRIQDPFRCVALIPEHWRYYPDGTVGSHVVGFLNASQEAQYGAERTFNPHLRGQEGRIVAVSDPTGGQIVTGEQTVVDPRDGDTVVLTIDRFIQKEAERLLSEAVAQYDADSGQIIVMDPKTGRILAMANAPVFDSNQYSAVFGKEPIILTENQQRQVVVELYHPEERSFIVKAYIDDIFTASGRSLLSQEKQDELTALEELYDLKDIVRYYLYIGENSRREIFPTDRPNVWLKYRNNLGVGAYLNNAIQGIYEPGSVFKSVTMAIALDQGEVVPTDVYDDTGPVEVDEYTIKNALNAYYGKVTMTNCLEFSINTCMTNVSSKLGKKLFHRMIERFGFGAITGIELEDELPGAMQPWRTWSNALLATASYGQGISSTPLQVITAYTPLANRGKLMRPMIVDRIIQSDGTVTVMEPRVVDQVIRPETAETITAMLTSSVNVGFAKVAKVPGYRIAGKTGTSQIAGPGGKYETGTGSTIATFAGYAPIEDPKFLILVKFDRPRKDEYGSKTAGPVFQKMAAFLFKYYGIPPDET
ncbi:MAG: penicillin-binding protein 2 [Candidatus Peribacteraceae bacterium]|nr:penicillin-binding protein 2 [Candidatus Peribacteraceae bacterium]